MKVRYDFWLTEQRRCDFEITQELIDQYNIENNSRFTKSDIETVVAIGEGALSTDGMSEADIERANNIHDDFIDWLTDEAFNSEERWELVNNDVQDWERRIV